MFTVRKLEAGVVTIPALAILACAQIIVPAASTAPDVTYTASGKFGSKPVSGSDLFRLAGEPFSLSVIASESASPHSHGKGYATYTNLTAKGTVTSALIPQSPFTLGSSHTFLALALGNPKYDVVELEVPVIVVKQQVRISAKLALPTGTFTKWTIAPFKDKVALGTADSTVTYTDGSDSTTLAIASGSLSTQTGPAGTAAVAMQ